MPSTDFLSIGISGLLSSQSAITTTSHNIANVNTEGFSRQTVDFGTNIANFSGAGYTGTGVVTNSVKRIFDNLALLDLRSNISNHSSLETFINQADRIDSIVADPTTGLSPAIQNFFNALQAVADDPGSIATRQSLFSQTDLLVDRFQLLDNQLSTQRISINNELDSVATQVTKIGSAIASINKDIIQALGSSSAGAKPNDLLDTRDKLVNDLSELVKVSTVEQKDGALNIFIGNGQTLVIGLTANEVIAEQDPNDPENNRISIVSGNVTIPVTNDIVGGQLGGLIEYRKEILSPAINSLGLASMGLSSAINTQHQLGMDINNELGGLFFTDINSTISQQNRVIANTTNTGNAQISMTIDDANSVSTKDYSLDYDAGTTTYTLRNASDNSIITTFVDPSPASQSFTSEGFTLNFPSGTVADGDRYLLIPTRATVGLMGKSLTDLTQIAAASPIAGSSDLSNTGTAKINSTVVTDTSTSAFASAGSLSPPIRFEFTAANTYSVINDSTNAVLAAGIAFVPNQNNDMLAQAGLSLGYEVSIGGAAVTGDVFKIEYNTGGIGDNSNALALASIQTENVLNNGTSTIQEIYGLLVSEIGTRTNEGKISYSAAQSLLRQSEARVESVSGVNLDEEAAKLIKFQQSYQASAQIISTANVLFDSLMSAVR